MRLIVPPVFLISFIFYFLFLRKEKKYIYLILNVLGEIKRESAQCQYCYSVE